MTETKVKIVKRIIVFEIAQNVLPKSDHNFFARTKFNEPENADVVVKKSVSRASTRLPDLFQNSFTIENYDHLKLKARGGAYGVLHIFMY